MHLELEASEESRLVRALKHLLKRLGRDYEVRCKSITWEGLREQVDVDDDLLPPDPAP